MLVGWLRARSRRISWDPDIFYLGQILRLPAQDDKAGDARYFLFLLLVSLLRIRPQRISWDPGIFHLGQILRLPAQDDKMGDVPASSLSHARRRAQGDRAC